MASLSTTTTTTATATATATASGQTDDGVSNELSDLLREALTSDIGETWIRILTFIKEHEPKEMHEYFARRENVKLFGWGFPTGESMEKIKEHLNKNFSGEKLLSICSGLGMPESWLVGKGFSVTMTDETPVFEECEKLTAQKACEKYKSTHEVLIVSWPPYGSECAYKCAEKGNFSCIIYIGEGLGGCCANDDFFNFLDEKYDIELYPCKRWYGIHDQVFICTLKK